MIENSPFLAMNSLVPSSGSTNQQRARVCASPCVGALFGDDAVVREALAQPALEQRVGAAVGLGHRIARRLVRDAEIGGVDLEQDATRFARELGRGRELLVE